MCRTRLKPKSGFTLVELLMGMTITAMLSVVLGGLIMAVQTAREHTEGLEEATAQAQAAIDRIKFIVSQAGVYQISGEPTTLGLAVVHRRVSGVDLPEILVVWSGDRSSQETGGMAAQVQSRLPRIDELALFAPDPNDPARLVEIAFPNHPGSIDFRDSSRFSDTVLSLIDSAADDEKLLLCKRIRRSYLNGGSGAGASVGNVRFHLTKSPGEDQLVAADPGSTDWRNLPWAQGIVAGGSGLRQATLRMELQVLRQSGEGTEAESATAAVPFFGSASYRYVYRPN